MYTRALSADLGVEVIGVDLEKPLSHAVKSELRALWVKHGVLLFRDVESDEAHIRASELFGELRAAANADLNRADNPFLMERAYDPGDAETKPVGRHIINGQPVAGWIGWHWDQSFMPEIVRGAALRLITKPREGGRTGFIDAIAAYDRLPDDLKDRIENLEIVYEYTGAPEKNVFGFPRDIQVVPGASLKGTPGDPARFSFPPVVHPLVITQPETGYKILKLSPMHSKYILGMDRAESDALLHEIADSLVDDRYAYYHDWEVNDLLAWDNWRLIHCFTGVPLDTTRRTRRTTIMGDYAGGRYLAEVDRASAPDKFIYD